MKRVEKFQCQLLPPPGAMLFLICVFFVEGTFSSAVCCDYQLYWDQHSVKNTKWTLYMNQVEKWTKWAQNTI